MKRFFNYRYLALFSVLVSIILISSCSNQRSGDPQVLVFSKTAGFRHESIPDGIKAVEKLGEENGFDVYSTDDAAYFTQENLDKYAAVVFMNTTGDVFAHEQEVVFERYIQSGGGFVGVHSATDTEYGWPWYGKLVGAYFRSHPHIQEADFHVVDSTFIAMEHLGRAIWKRTDELYNFNDINTEVNVLMTVDEGSYEGGENGEFHPMAWYHGYDGGRAFYTAMGHTSETFEEEDFLKHLLGGITYAIGDNKKLNYKAATTPLGIEQDRFTKVQLSLGEFYEPTEMAILPNNDVLIAQRRGQLMRYSEDKGELKQVGYLDVYHESGVEGVNAEEGFMGLQRDPNFAENNWVYCYYAPTGDLEVNRLSRFKYIDDTLQMNTEQVILDVASDRYICCHTGGSVTFGGDGLLYLSTGDNTTPFDEPDVDYVNNGYAPLNDLPGKSQYDARRSSSNTNDLRGKVLRIKVNEDGTYDIPEGNLFPVGTENARPEIYTMGHRNPYRIAVDPKNGNLYWGDVGPDAGDNDLENRGPRGYDEVNVAVGPGYFGWPLFIADNKPYVDYDYSNGKSGVTFDADKPINDSKYNTGLTELPPASPAIIYYPYDESPKFGSLESGGRNAMAGPTYYSDLFNGPDELPSYFEGKTIVYDWMRGWMKAITVTEDGRLKSMEPFAPTIELNALIDMEFGPDGRLYMLEYGSGWFTANKDSGLSYLKYNEGNRPPQLNSFTADHSSGPAPLTVALTADAVDGEDGKMTYQWDFGDGTTETTESGTISHEYADPGSYEAKVEIYDEQNMKVSSQIIDIVSGNTRPEIEIEITEGNSSFYMEGVPVMYDISVSDVEDGQGDIDMGRLIVNVEYLEGFDEASLGHIEADPVANGQALTLELTCKTCHKADGESIGPSYTLVAEKYKDDPNVVGYLTEKIQKGGSGVWGANAMAANPDVTDAMARDMIRYIMSLSPDAEERSLPPSGAITPEAGNDQKQMIITASYTDNGAPGAVPLTNVVRKVLSSNFVSVLSAIEIVDWQKFKFDGMDLLILPRSGGSFALENVDLSGVKNINLIAGWQKAPTKPVELEIRNGGPDGEVIGKGGLLPPEEGSSQGVIALTLGDGISGKHDKITFTYNPDKEDKLGMLDAMAVVGIQFSGE